MDFRERDRRPSARRPGPTAWELALIAELRRILRPDLRGCPHCAELRVQRWGHFSGRQRYRCLGCGRTFSDFTGTVLSYLKRLERWADFCRHAGEPLSVRRTATALGVHRDTALRWRHRLLGSVVASEHYLLRGEVDVGWCYFPFSQKGERRLDRPARRRGRFRHWEEPRAWVLLACDRRGRSFGRHVGPRRPGHLDLERGLVERVHRGAVLMSEQGHYGDVALAARRAGLGWKRKQCGWVDCSGRARTGGTAGDVGRAGVRLRIWLKQFHGVATRYLNHYLGWFRLTERLTMGGHCPIRTTPTQWLVMAGRFPR